jgi:hypothetical protein
MNTHELKPGDRVRLTAGCQMHGYQAGDKGTVVHGPIDSADGLRDYPVELDKDGPAGTTPILAEDEIELDG